MPLVPVLLNNASLVSTTRLGLSGYSRGPFGNFANKPIDVGEEITIRTRTPYEVFILREEHSSWQRTQIIFSGKTFPLVTLPDDC